MKTLIKLPKDHTEVLDLSSLVNDLNLNDTFKIKVAGFSVDNIQEALVGDDWEHGEFESNGWEMNFWLTMSKEKKKVVISGCGYYDTTINVDLTIKDSEEDSD